MTQRYVVPEEGLKAAAVGYEEQRRLAYSQGCSGHDIVRAVLEAFIRWQSEREPTDEEAKELIRVAFGYGTNDWNTPTAVAYIAATKDGIKKLLRRMYLSPSRKWTALTTTAKLAMENTYYLAVLHRESHLSTTPRRSRKGRYWA